MSTNECGPCHRPKLPGRGHGNIRSEGPTDGALSIDASQGIPRGRLFWMLRATDVVGEDQLRESSRGGKGCFSAGSTFALISWGNCVTIKSDRKGQVSPIAPI